MKFDFAAADKATYQLPNRTAAWEFMRACEAGSIPAGFPSLDGRNHVQVSIATWQARELADGLAGGVPVAYEFGTGGGVKAPEVPEAMAQQNEAREECERMARETQLPPAPVSTIPLRMVGVSEWDAMHALTKAKHFSEEAAWRYLATQFWAWPGGDAIVTPTNVTLRIGDVVTLHDIRNGGGLFSALKQRGEDPRRYVQSAAENDAEEAPIGLAA